MAAERVRIADGFPGERLTILPEDVVRHSRTLPLCQDVCVTHTGRFDRVFGHYVTRPGGRPEYILIVCLDGAGSVRLRSTTWKLRQGHGIMLPPRVPHHYEADAAEPWSVFWFHFKGRRAEDCARALGCSLSHPRFWIQGVDSLIEAFEDCYRYVLGGYSDADLIGLTTSFLRVIGLCRALQRSHSVRRRLGEERVIQSVRFMRKNVHRPINLDEIAREAGVSIPHFSAIFRRQMRCSPMKFLNRLRMQEACERLVTTNLGVAEIAYSLGFEDPLYFSRCFHERIGVPPSEYCTHSGRHRSRAKPG